MKQQTISDVEYSARKRKTKREEFLEIMDEIIPWEEWVEYIKPYYPSGKRGRPPKGIEKMLRMYLLQCRFNLSDEGVGDAIYSLYFQCQRECRRYPCLLQSTECIGNSGIRTRPLYCSTLTFLRRQCPKHPSPPRSRVLYFSRKRRIIVKRLSQKFPLLPLHAPEIWDIIYRRR